MESLLESRIARSVFSLRVHIFFFPRIHFPFFPPFILKLEISLSAVFFSPERNEMKPKTLSFCSRFEDSSGSILKTLESAAAGAMKGEIRKIVNLHTYFVRLFQAGYQRQFQK